MSAEQHTVERSALDKKPEWGGAQQQVAAAHHQLHHHLLPRQLAHFLPYHHLHHQTLQQMTQRAFDHHQQLVGGCLNDAAFRPDAGISPAEGGVFESPKSTVEACGAQHAGSFSMASENTMACTDHGDVGDTHEHWPISLPQGRLAMPAQDTISRKDKQASSVTMVTQPHQERRERDHAMAISKGSLNISPSIKPPASRRSRNTSMSPLTVRPTGTKDRHSKVRTAKGLRDRRVRLSAPTAIQFFDVQDRLGYDQPSKAVDWLIKKARAAIDELAPVEGVVAGNESADGLKQERKSGKDQHNGSISDVKVKDEEQNMVSPSCAIGYARAESRAKARERARERAKERGISFITPSAITSAAESRTIASGASTVPVPPLVPASASPNVHLLPEFFLLSSHIRQQLDDPHRTVPDLSSMLLQPSSSLHTPHLLPLPSHFLPARALPSSASSFAYTGDAPPPFPFSAPPVFTSTAAPISPRGTLQSIFSHPANSSMQAHTHMPSLSMMVGALQQTHASYGAVLNSVRETDGYDSEDLRQRSVELGSPDLHQHSRIPMRIHGMDLDSSAVEETRIGPPSMAQAEFQ